MLQDVVINLYSEDDEKLPTLRPITSRTGKLILDIAVEVFNETKTSFWLSAGTCLGLYRDGEFLPKDYDVDIEFVSHNPEKTKEIYDIFYKRGFRLYRTMIHGEEYTQIAMINPSGVLLDLYLYRDNLIDGYYVNINEHGILLLPKDMVSTGISFLDYQGSRYPVPGPTEEYLRFRFGSGWGTPKSFERWTDCAGRAFVKL
jgi:hypothetical protein